MVGFKQKFIDPIIARSRLNVLGAIRLALFPESPATARETNSSADKLLNQGVFYPLKLDRFNQLFKRFATSSSFRPTCCGAD